MYKERTKFKGKYTEMKSVCSSKSFKQKRVNANILKQIYKLKWP